MISVIIPVYNVEKYLPECIESILNQTYPHFELILVDDGSTDNSGKICDEYAARDNRIKAIHQKNSGGARGGVITGVNASSGDYICFLDSDDYFRPETLEVLLSEIQQHNADCVQFQVVYVQDGVETINTKRTLEILDNDTLRKEVIGKFLKTGSRTQTQWSYGRTDKFYKADLVKKIIPHLDVNITLCEDVDMSLWIALFCNKAVILEDCYLYCWRFVVNSISKSIAENTIPKHTYFIDSLYKFAQTNNFTSEGVYIVGDKLYIDLMITALIRDIPVFLKSKHLKLLKSLVKDKNNISQVADDYAFITRNALKYLARFDTLIPSILSQLYHKIQK